MKIGIEAQRIFRKKKHGMDIVALEMIKALQNLDRENEYFIFVKPDEDTTCLQETANFKIIEVYGRTYADWEQYSLPKALQKTGIELLHCTSNTAPLSVSVPLVLTLHDIIYLERVSFRGSFYQNAGNLYRRFVVPKVVRHAQKVLTVSHYEKTRIAQKLQVPPTQLEVAYNGIHPRFQVYSDNSQLDFVAKHYGLPRNFIFFLGNKAPKKNMENVLKAYSIYRDITSDFYPLVIAESNQKHLTTLLKKIGAPELEEDIVLTGYIPQDHLPFIYNLSNLFLYPSLRESFGIPIIEAMACGTPVITSNTSAMPEIAKSAAQLVNPLDSGEIALAIKEILRKETLQKNLIRRGLKRATYFSWTNTAREALKAYKQCLEQEKQITLI